MVQAKTGPRIKKPLDDYEKSSKVSCEDPKHRAEATKSLGMVIDKNARRHDGFWKNATQNDKHQKSNILLLQKLHSSSRGNGKSNWYKWNIWFLTWAMKFPDCYAWLTTGNIPVFDTEDMEEWLEIEGHPEMVVKDQWRGRQGESRWTSLHRGNESRASKFFRQAGLVIEMLLSSIKEEIFNLITLDDNLLRDGARATYIFFR